YILRIILATHQHYETTEAKKYFEKLVRIFRKHHELVKEKMQAHRRMPQATKTKISNFYGLMERCFASLEVLYDKKDFIEALRCAYEEKMYYRKHHFLFQKKRWRYFEYTFLDVTCKYGDSFFRWGITALTFAGVLSVVYYFLDRFVDPAYKMISHGHYYDYLYFSMVTMTTAGYGDIVPIHPATKFFAMTEVFFGFIMLGVFVNMIQKKL
ncbi:two pore domain potassium channel family protein, partial [Candidatus Peregrinibacteria bacterium]|nr:two pore domain potassium channel family protein [Candidatus Peregrinibacteria bacterium]